MHSRIKCQQQFNIFKPPGMIVREGLMLQFISFSLQDLRGLWADLRKILPHGWKHVQFTNAGPKIWGLPPHKNLGVKNMLNLARFRTPSYFELEFLWNGQRYPKKLNYRQRFLPR